jgi:hypothetical protein
MIRRKSILGFNAVAALVMIVASATTLPIGSTVLDAEAQNADTSQQIRDYLIQAIQAIDSGDKTEAIQQLQLASNQMGTDLTGVSVQSMMLKTRLVVVVVKATTGEKRQRKDQERMLMNQETETKTMRKTRI